MICVPHNLILDNTLLTIPNQYRVVFSEDIGRCVRGKAECNFILIVTMYCLMTWTASFVDRDRSVQSLQNIYTMGPVTLFGLRSMAKATLRINSISAAPAKSLIR